MRVIAAVDVSGSTIWYEPYYDMVEQVLQKHPPSEVWMWNHECRRIAHEPSFRTMRRLAGGFTEPRCVLRMLERQTRDVDLLVIVTDAMCDRIDKLDVERYSLSKVHRLVTYFFGDPAKMNLGLEAYFFRPHMVQVSKSDSVQALLTVAAVRPSDDLFSAETSNNVTHVARYGTPQQLAECRVAVLACASNARKAKDPAEFERLCRDRDAAACFDYVRRACRSGTEEKNVDSRLNFLMHVLDEKRKDSLYSTSFLRGGQTLESAVGDVGTQVYEETFDPVMLEECHGALSFLLLDNECPRTNTAKDALTTLVCQDWYDYSVEKEVYSYDTYERLPDKHKSPMTRRKLAGAFVVDKRAAYRHNSRILAICVNGYPRLYGSRALWHVAFCYAAISFGGHPSDVVESLAKYCAQTAAEEKCHAPLDPHIDPRLEVKLSNALWYSACVSYMFKSGSVNVPRHRPDSDLCDIFEVVTGESAPQEAKSANDRYRTYEKAYAGRASRRETFGRVDGLCLEGSECVLVADGEVDKQALVLAASWLHVSTSDVPKFSNLDSVPVAKVAFPEEPLAFDFELMRHVSFDRETCRHSPICRVTGMPWKDCCTWTDGPRMRRTSLFESYFCFVETERRNPMDVYEFAARHAKKRFVHFKEVVFPRGTITAMQMVMDTIDLQLSGLSAQEITERRRASRNKIE